MIQNMVSKVFTIWSNNNFLIVSHKVKCIFTYMLNIHQICIIAVRHHFILWENIIPEIIIGFINHFLPCKIIFP